jgi:hypothetical protein
MTFKEIYAKIPRGNWTIQEVADFAGCTTQEAYSALAEWYRPRVAQGYAGPRWNKERNAHLYPW